MADPQVAGLQRAYAEIMLNMAKESAARVLAAEQRAAVLAGEVAAAKEDGIAALVRLKTIMEAKIKKVESHTSAAHVKKINVLQEQLHDAQNTVATLQVELQKANTELEHTRKTLAEERTKILPTSDKVDSDQNRGPPSKMHLQNRSVSLKNKTTADNIYHVLTNAEENGAVENLEKLCRSGSDMSSFMQGNKKSKLYRKGCTQRVRAIKQRSHSADSSLEQNSKQACALNSCLKIEKNDTARMPSHTGSIMEQILQTKFLATCKRKRGRRSRPSYMHDSSGEHVKTEYKSSDTSDENGCLLLLQALKHDLSPPNMFTRHSGEGLTDLKDYLAMGGKDANICTASSALIDAHISNMQMTRRKRSKTVRVFEDGFCESKSVPISGNTLLRSKNENTVSSSEQFSERIHNSSDTPPINNAFVSSDGTENLMHPSQATENLMHPSDANTSQLMSGNSSPPVLQSTKSQIGGEGELQEDQPEDLSAGLKELNVDGSCNLASDRADPLTINSLDKEHNPNSSSRVSMQAVGSRCIKYTFNRRKRKSASLDTPPQGDVPEKSSSLAPAGSSSLADKQEPQAKPGTQDPLVESPLCDSQLVHVAQQLILLSELKW